jgi:ribosome biogenesis GTPase
MAKRQLNRRQAWRIDKIQNERADRAAKRESQAVEVLEGGDLGPEETGLIIAHYGVQVEVEAQQGERAGQVFRCHLRANLPAMVTGDRVVWRAGNQGIGVIVAQLPRSTELCRPDHRGQLKPVAANVDLIVIVFAPAPEPQANLIDRYLVAAEHSGIHPLLLLNKADLINADNEARLNDLLEAYRQLGYPLLEVSAHEGDGMEQLKERLKGHTSVFVGQSGVGKSSLVNQLLPEAQARVGALSEWSGQGQHTTTTAKLFHFPQGGDLIDSPGIREFGLMHVSRDDVEAGFIEFDGLLGHCRFRDCKHDREPGCALLMALEDGRIHPQRMHSYRSIIASLAEERY